MTFIYFLFLISPSSTYQNTFVAYFVIANSHTQEFNTSYAYDLSLYDFVEILVDVQVLLGLTGIFCFSHQTPVYLTHCIC